MASIPGSVQVTGFIAPTDTTDTYPSHDAIYGRDGLRSVSTLVARNAISSDRRREGMLVYVIDTTSYYRLLPSPWDFTNSDWVNFPSGGSTVYGQDFTDSDLIAGVLTAIHSLGTQYNSVVIYNDSDSAIIPDGITATSTSVVDVDISSYGTISGTWRLLVVPGYS